MQSINLLTTLSMRFNKNCQSRCFNVLSLAVLLSLVVNPVSVFGLVVTYPAPPGCITSPDFSCTVNGQSAWVESFYIPSKDLTTYPNLAGAHVNVVNISASGQLAVVLTVPDNITSAKISPLRLGIKGLISGKTLSFTVSAPQKLLIDVNGYSPFVFLANPLEVNPPTQGSANVTYYGPGVHNLNRIELQNNWTYYIAGGAIINGCFRGTNITNTKIIGRGIIDANNQTGPVRLTNCSNITVDGVFTRRGTNAFQISPVWCNKCTFNNVKVFDWTIYGDGIDPQECRNILINDCFIMAADDQIAIKSDPRYHTAGRTDSITVTNTITHVMPGTVGDGLTIGFELNADSVTNILVKNCDFLRSDGGGGTNGHSSFSIVLGGKAYVRNIRFENISSEDNGIKNFELHIFNNWQGWGTGDIKGVYLKNIKWYNATKPIYLTGLDANHLIQDVTFDNCSLGTRLVTSAVASDPNLFKINQFVKNVTLPTSIYVKPPAQKVPFKTPTNKSSIKVFNILGREVSGQSSSRKLTKGIYFIGEKAVILDGLEIQYLVHSSKHRRVYDW